MNAPLNRDKQIELMATAKQRHKAVVRTWLQNPAVREVLSRPAPGQDEDEVYVQTSTTVVARCG